eukprot:scaffold776_cov347-Pavlova_lutheri.AAC.114
MGSRPGWNRSQKGGRKGKGRRQPSRVGISHPHPRGTIDGIAGSKGKDGRVRNQDPPPVGRIRAISNHQARERVGRSIGRPEGRVDLCSDWSKRVATRRRASSTPSPNGPHVQPGTRPRSMPEPKSKERDTPPRRRRRCGCPCIRPALSKDARIRSRTHGWVRPTLQAFDPGSSIGSRRARLPFRSSPPLSFRGRGIHRNRLVHVFLRPLRLRRLSRHGGRRPFVFLDRPIHVILLPPVLVPVTSGVPTRTLFSPPEVRVGPSRRFGRP